MPEFFLDIPVSVVTGHQTFSVKARSLKEAKRKFKAHESMKFVREELDVDGLEDIEDAMLDDIYKDTKS